MPVRLLLAMAAAAPAASAAAAANIKPHILLVVADDQGY
eukprot:SAG22_NODE_13523_length_403_cov_1.348684_1_plen_38_part_10